MRIESGLLIVRAGRRNIELPRRTPRELPDETKTEGRIYLSPDVEKTQRMRRVADIFITDVAEFRGQEFIPQIMELGDTHSIVGVGNHLTDLDHAARRKVLESANQKALADRLAFFAGYKMYERPWTNVWMGAEHSVYGPTPDDLDKVEAGIAKYKARGHLNLIERALLALLTKYQKNLNLGGVAALEKMREIRNAKNLIPYNYPESTRSRSGKLGKAPRRVGRTFGRDGYIFSMVVTGQEISVPAGKVWNPLKRGPVLAVLGEPYLASKIWNWRTEGAKIGEDRNPADFVMAEIASHLCDDQIEPVMLPIYREIFPRRST